MNTPEHCINNDKFIGTKKNIINMHNEFFTNVGPDFAKNITTPVGSSVFDYLQNRNDNCMFLSPVDKKYVHKVVENCKNKGPADADGLSMNIVKLRNKENCSNY